MKINKILAFIFVTFFSFQSLSPAADVKAMRNQAYTDIVTAMRLKQEAEATLKQGSTVENFEAAKTLFIQAGKFFEKANRIYTKLAPDNATEEDIVNSEISMQNCIRDVQEINQRLAEAEQTQ